MNGENQPRVTNEPGESEEKRSKFKTPGKLPIIVEEYREYTSKP